MTTTKHTIDATGKAIGRVASEAAQVLMGKTSPSFERNKVSPVSVTIENASKVKISEKKKQEVSFEKYSGYPGGLKMTSLADFIDQKGYGELFKNAVFGMLPRNKLRPRMMKNLTVKE